MRKIVLNEYGESVSPQEKFREVLIYGVKIHSFCGGFVELRKVSKTHHAFHCRRCNFRFVFPIEIDTWSKLKQFVKESKNDKKRCSSIS